ncbi:MAG: S-methyl-5'-thioadenosine phosphorylase [Pseudomonadota bacterium]|nr:S-methyl-5'-thioadenosine phosphorylase [Pseudomonadota bacterium]
MDNINIAFIGGSGLYKVPSLKKIKWKAVKTNFGSPSSPICIGEINEKRIAFLPRHGKTHNIPPSNINYRANIEALKKIGVENIISLSAVGSLRNDYVPGDFVLVDQFIDKTYKREKTFFDEDLVVHLPFSNPICSKLKSVLAKTLKLLHIKFHNNGTYICIEGPQFSTLAESELYRSWGCDVIGMTNMPEAKLAMEAGICYVSVAMVTDYDCWHPDHENVTIESIIKTLNDNSYKANKLILELSKSDRIECDGKIKNLSMNSIITDTTSIKKSTKLKLKNIIKIKCK